MTLETDMAALGRAAQIAGAELRLANEDMRNAALRAMAKHIRKANASILAANKADMEAAAEKGLSAPLLDRLKLDTNRIEGIAEGLQSIADLPDPIGSIETEWTQPNGLHFSKVRVPLGVIGMIYESRPNVTADAGGLCVKSGNACVLRGGSESMRSNRAIHRALQFGLRDTGLPETAINLVQTTDRSAVGFMLDGLNATIDLIIPRGGKGLVSRVQKEARVPVLAHEDGLNHSYVHKSAKINTAVQVIENAKLRRTSVCGSTETVLVDKDIASEFLPALEKAIGEKCELRADNRALLHLKTAILASNTDFETEHLAPILNIAVVDDIDAALTHIAKYGSGHTDAILAENVQAANIFLDQVDSAIVLHNASTQYADGGEFGFGAEIGIATGRIHARGPVGAQHLTSYKYQVRGAGQTRP
ncbi:MAG: glutamate-5-semialdehyde dehydrogenase [Litorimonas sp.]